MKHFWAYDFKDYIRSNPILEDVAITECRYDPKRDTYSVTLFYDGRGFATEISPRSWGSGMDDASRLLWFIYNRVKSKAPNQRAANTKEITLKDGSTMHIIDDEVDE